MLVACIVGGVLGGTIVELATLANTIFDNSAASTSTTTSTSSTGYGSTSSTTAGTTTAFSDSMSLLFSSVSIADNYCKDNCDNCLGNETCILGFCLPIELPNITHNCLINNGDCDYHTLCIPGYGCSPCPPGTNGTGEEGCKGERKQMKQIINIH